VVAGLGPFAADLRIAVRTLVRRPLFLIVSVVTIGIGVGAVTAIFSIVDGVLWRPLPYRSADRIVRVGGTFPDGSLGPVSPAMYFDWRAGTASFDGLAGVYRQQLDLAGTGEPERFDAIGASAGFADVFGVELALGRWFSAEEDAPGAPPVVVLDHGLWQHRWGGDPGVLGSTLTLNGQPFTVIGVLSSKFVPPEGLGRGLGEAVLWFPLARIDRDLTDRGNYFIRVVGRLKEGVSAVEARSEVTALTTALVESYGSDEPGEDFGVQLDALRDATVGSASATLIPLFGAVALLLLIACVNVLNLVIARNADRAREFGVRLALGAGRVALLRQLVAESLVLSVVGCGIGVLLARAGVDLFTLYSTGDIPRMTELVVDGRVLVFALALSAGLPFLLGLLPALGLRKDGLAGLAGAVRGVGGSCATARTRTALVVAETALALVILMGAGLLLASFARLVRVDPGFRAEDVAVVHVGATARYDEPASRLAYFNEMKAAIGSIPGVGAVGLSSALPFGDTGMGGSIQLEGWTDEVPPRFERWQLVDEDFLPVLGVEALPGGRLFEAGDLVGGPSVVVINEAFARRYWPGEDAVGRRLQIISTGPEAPWRTVIGVVRDFKQQRLSAATQPEVYVPFTQSRVVFNEVDLAVSSTNGTAVLAPALREAVWRVDPDQPIAWISTLEARIGRSTRRARFYAVLLSTFGIVALTLAVVGIYGTVSWNVGRRTPELGIRMVLGASSRSIVRRIVGRTAAAIGTGILIGAVAASAVSGVLDSLLFGVGPTDPATFAAVAGALLGAGVLAAWLPALRASRIDPAASMRSD
jgi:putative ABC transport system permease protein